MKKFLSVVLATSMLMSMTAISSVQAQTQTSDYTLEFEAEKSWEKMYEADGASGGDYMWVFYDQEADVSSTVSTTIEESGFYYVDVVAANKGTNSYLSNMSLSINDGAPTDFYNYANNKNNTAHVTVGDEVSFVARASSEAKNTQLNNLVYLEAGENTFKVALAARTQAEGDENVGTYAGALDCIKLTKYELAETGDGEAVVEAEDFDWRYSAVSEPAGKYPDVIGYASGGGLINMRGGVVNGLTYRFGVEATKAGCYNLDVYAACEATNKYLSTMKVAVNDGAAANLKSGTTVTSLPNTYLSETYKVQSIKMDDPVYLNKGVNEITVTITASSAQEDKTRLLFALDCIKVTAYDNAVDEGRTIEIEDFYSSALKDNDLASGKKVMFIQEGSSTETSRTVTAYANEEGYYKLNLWAGNNLTAAKMASDQSSQLSSMTVIVNDTFEKKVTKTNFTMGDTALYTQQKAAYPVYDFTLKQLVYLKAGENNITVKLSKRSASAGGCYGALDCIKLERYPVATIGEDGATIEAEDFDWYYNTAVENSVASGGACHKMVGGALLERVITVAANAEYAGNYKLNIWAGCETTAPYISKMKVSVNGGDAIDLTGNTTVTPLPDYGTGYNNIFVSDLALNNSVYLNEGINTFDIIITPSAGQENKEQITFVLDCIKLTPSVIKVGEDETKLEFEEATAIANNISVEDNSEASNGLYTLMYYSDPASYSFDLNVQSAGDYALLVAGTIGTALSPLSIKVNDNAPITLDYEGDDKNCELLGEKYTLYNDYMNDLQLGDYLLTEPLSLNEGRNNITVTVSGLGSGSELAVLDYMSLTKLVSYDDLAMDELEVCMLDAVQNVALSNDGAVITNEDAYITYQSSNEDVAVVDGTGAIKAVGMGTAIISAAVYPQAVTPTPRVVSQKITVVGADGVWVSDMSVSNGDVSFNANALFASNAAEAVVACYDAQSGVLKSVDTVAVPAMSAGASTPLEAELSTYASGDNVSIMLFDSLGNIRPLWVKSNI